MSAARLRQCVGCKGTQHCKPEVLWCAELGEKPAERGPTQAERERGVQCLTLHSLRSAKSPAVTLSIGIQLHDSLAAYQAQLQGFTAEDVEQPWLQIACCSCVMPCTGGAFAQFDVKTAWVHCPPSCVVCCISFGFCHCTYQVSGG